jgi:hypothetical protein
MTWFPIGLGVPIQARSARCRIRRTGLHDEFLKEWYLVGLTLSSTNWHSSAQSERVPPRSAYSGNPASKFRTVVACHLPSRAVRKPRLLGASAIPV